MARISPRNYWRRLVLILFLRPRHGKQGPDYPFQGVHSAGHTGHRHRSAYPPGGSTYVLSIGRELQARSDRHDQHVLRPDEIVHACRALGGRTRRRSDLEQRNRESADQHVDLRRGCTPRTSRPRHDSCCFRGLDRYFAPDTRVGSIGDA